MKLLPEKKKRVGNSDAYSVPGAANERECETSAENQLLRTLADETPRYLFPRFILSVVFFIAAIVFKTPAVKTILFALAALICGTGIIIRSVKCVQTLRFFDENVLMLIAAVGAFLIGESAEGAAVIILYQLGEFLQDRAADSSRKTIKELLDLRPDTVLRVEDGMQVTVPAGNILPGDIFIAAPGERIALDGKIISGESEIDTSALTGEAMPRFVAADDIVYAGCLNLTGALHIEATKSLEYSSVSRILALVEKAEKKKSPTERFITRFARKYTPAVLFIALIIAVIVPLISGQMFSEWIKRGLVFLVISCPCALVISVPLTFFAGMGGAAGRGILFKGADVIEKIADTDTVVFDKTGTLTSGKFRVTNIVPKTVSKDDLLMAAACAEAFSNHPIAKAITEEYGRIVDASRISRYREIRGKGAVVEIGNLIAAAGNASLMEEMGIKFEKADTSGTAVYVSVGCTFAGYIILEDAEKPDAQNAVEQLRELGVERIAVFTGDRPGPAEEVANRLGIKEVCAELLPEDKADQLELVRESQTNGKTLVFVGDGINDAPVIAMADVGVAMGGIGSDAAIEAADMIVMTDEPSKVAEAIVFSRAVKRVVKQNIVFCLGIKAIIMILGAVGIANMWLAVFADVGVAVLASVNALRAYTGSDMKLPKSVFFKNKMNSGKEKE